jgi:hypothetical protein
MEIARLARLFDHKRLTVAKLCAPFATFYSSPSVAGFISLQFGRQFPERDQQSG